MHQSAGNAPKYAAGKLLVNRLRRRQVRFFAFLDQRANNIGLTPRLDFLFHEIVNQPSPFLGPHERPHRLTSRRQTLDTRNVEIAVYRQGHRPRNRRRRHDEHVRRLFATLFQLGALGDAEAVLLVGYYKPQLVIANLVLDQRVGPDDDINLMRRDGRKRFFMLLGRKLAGKKPDANSRIRQKPRECLAVLAREDFRRRHQDALIAVFHGLGQREKRDGRLSRADVPLHEPPHRRRLFHIDGYFFPGFRLSFCQLERERTLDFLHKASVHQMTDALLFFLRLLFHEQQSALNQVQFFKGEPGPRLRQCFHRRRKMHGAEGLVTSHQRITGANAFGDYFGHFRLFLKRLLHQVAEKFLIQAGRRRVNGKYLPLRLRNALVHHLKGRHLRHREKASPPVGIFDFPGREDAPSHDEFFCEIRLIEPCHRQKSRAVAQAHVQNADATHSPSLIHMDNRAENGGFHPRRKRRKLTHRALVDIGTRIISQQIKQRRNAKTRKR